jgi:dihydrofolate reductase
MIISLIVATGTHRQIGLDGKMPWHIHAEFKHFKETTMGHHLIMGRKTFESIGEPLPGRMTIVLSHDPAWSHPHVLRAATLREALELAKSRGETEVFICGGSSVYEQALPLCQRLYLSQVDYTGPADAFFPSYEQLLWTKREDRGSLREPKTQQHFRIIYMEKEGTKL